MIRNIQRGNKRIFAEWVYGLSYEIGTGKFTCECEAFIWNPEKGCKHIKDFKRKLGIK